MPCRLIGTHRPLCCHEYLHRQHSIGGMKGHLRLPNLPVQIVQTRAITRNRKLYDSESASGPGSLHIRHSGPESSRPEHDHFQASKFHHETCPSHSSRQWCIKHQSRRYNFIKGCEVGTMPFSVLSTSVLRLKHSWRDTG